MLVHQVRITFFQFLKHTFFQGIKTFSSACIFSWVAPIFSFEPMLPYPGWYWIDWRNDMQSYWIAYTYQVIGVTFQTSTIILLQLLSIYFMAVIGAQLDILKYRLTNLGNTMNGIEILYSSVELQLVECIAVHNDLLRFDDLIMLHTYRKCFTFPIKNTLSLCQFRKLNYLLLLENAQNVPVSFSIFILLIFNCHIIHKVNVFFMSYAIKSDSTKTCK